MKAKHSWGLTVSRCLASKVKMRTATFAVGLWKKGCHPVWMIGLKYFAIVGSAATPSADKESPLALGNPAGASTTVLPHNGAWTHPFFRI